MGSFNRLRMRIVTRSGSLSVSAAGMSKVADTPAWTGSGAIAAGSHDARSTLVTIARTFITAGSSSRRARTSRLHNSKMDLTTFAGKLLEEQYGGVLRRRTEQLRSREIVEKELRVSREFREQSG
jgi:hypothetical protein